jgi:hypothetical protein
LPHIIIACRAARGNCDLSTSDDGKSVVLTVSLPAQLLAQPALSSSSDEIPKGGGSFNRAGSAHTRLDHASGEENAMPDGSKVFVIDDSAMLCKCYRKIILPKLAADMASSKVVRPISQECVDEFIANILRVDNVDEGLREAKITTEADVVILDQNIEFIELGVNRVVYGTDLAKQLRSHGYGGLLILRSANMEASDIEEYMRDGAIDECLGKAGSSQEVARGIRKAYRARRRKNAKTEENCG